MRAVLWYLWDAMEDVMMRRRKQQAGRLIKPLDLDQINRKQGIGNSSNNNNNNNGKGTMTREDDEGELLSPGSVVFHTPDFSIHILAIMGCKTSINLEIVKAKLPLTLLKHPRFSSIVVGDPSKGEELRWLRTEVDLDKHIIVRKMDGESMESSNKLVEDYTYNLSKSSLDKSRPLWDLHILHVNTSEPEEAQGIGIFRVHHSLGDGTSLISLLMALTRKMSDPEGLPAIPAQKRLSFSAYGQQRRKGKGLISRSWDLGLWLWWVLQLSWNTLVDLAMFLATMLFLKDTSTPLKGAPGVEFTPRRVVYKTISLDDIKLVKNTMNATVNDVALGITQAGLSRYLCRRGGNDGNKINHLPKHIRIRSVLLINVRPSTGIQALADMMEKDAEAKWGNSIGYVLLPFKIGLRDDPLDYIREAKATVDRKKHSLEALFTFFIAELVMKLLGTKVASALSHRINSHTTMCFSNLVGPLEEIGFYGHPMAFLAPSSYGQPQALMINFQSYVNKMTMVLSVDEGTIPDPKQLCDDIAESLQLAKEAVLKQGLVKGVVAATACPPAS